MASRPTSLVSSAAAPTAPAGTTYARARLRLGIACVGTFVVVSAVLLSLDGPSEVLPASTSWAWRDVAWLALLVAGYAAVSAPFDALGGLVLPRRFGRPAAAARFWRAWARGAAVHGACLLAVALALLGAGRAGGDAAALAAAAALMLAMLAGQARLALLIGGVRRSEGLLASSDPSFVGGIVGVPGKDATVLAAGWDADTTHVQAVRRVALRRSGSRALGVVVALLFALSGLALALLATPASADSVAGLATASLWTTLWSFAGLLVLPSLSRSAVHAADLAAIRAGVHQANLVRALRELDARQEDEPRRGALVETVFHPVPSLARRVAAIESGAGPRLPRPWHTARTALFLSWATLGLLSRAVHCNCGRPALWALFPGD